MPEGSEEERREVEGTVPRPDPVQQLWLLWRQGQRADVREFLDRAGPLTPPQVAAVLLVDQRERWLTGERLPAESYLPLYPTLRADLEYAVELIYGEYLLREELGDRPTLAEYQERFPQYASRFKQQLELHQALNSVPLAGPWQSEPPASDPVAARMPPQIGRYRVERILGEGGFGRVFLAHDDQLQRPVAIKVPHRKLVARPEEAEAYLSEARNVAKLDHPNIVPVFDVGSTGDCPCFVVSKFIEGSTLAHRIKEDRPACSEAAKLVATVAEALHCAHRKGLVHRDIKPGNLLLDSGGKPHIADFGLALKDENVGQGPKYAGTPAYMSPEQARGEGHRVDGRSDIFSLGVVFYELLTGRRPFKGKSREELLEQIADFEPRPTRQYDDRIPKELERICQKALAKRAVDRYSTAIDLADDLRHFLAEQAVPGGQSSVTPSATPVVPSPSTSLAPSRSVTPSSTPATPTSDSQPIKIVPKGLRSFDAQDADFFLELLPGPRDRQELPDSIRFWKTRIEETDPDNTFAVGLIYGPSGCGKSSLVKAGLLPRLSDMVTAVYIEATGAETETRLLHGLRKRCPALPVHLGLTETLAALRRGQGLPAGKKVLIVLDQFEQWLHAKREEHHTELVQALRQCDGGRVQCLVLVRDDFWLAATRFLGELEIALLQGQNTALADLFDLDHAKKVLAAFGRAFGKLPENPGETSKEQREFLKQAVSGLAQEGKVICVRLALFAEMMKGKPWTPTSLKQVGGTEGIGGTFLEETFSSPTANPKHRLHQQAARAVLKALLPESGTDIKGHMRSDAELLEASGYASRPKEFNDLLHMLDRELRLITPTDPEGADTAGQQPPTTAGGKYYQLTHDYLVHSLRDWLTRKQKETRRGRAELLLADRAGVWKARQENRQLPSLPQWVSIQLLTQRKNWTEPRRKMMRKATWYHAVRGVALALLLMAITLIGVVIRSQVMEQNSATRAAALVQRLLYVNIAQVPGIITEIEAYRAWADPLLREENEKAAKDSRQKLHTSLALLPVDPGQMAYLYNRLLKAEPHEVPDLRDALLPHKQELLDELWTVVEAPARGQERQRLRAACALAGYDPQSQRWAKVQDPIVNDLVGVPAVHFATWMGSLRPVRGKLQAPLVVVFRDASRPETERSVATYILADYAADQPQILADLLLDADAEQFAVLYPKLKDQGDAGRTLLLAEMNKPLLPDAKEDAKEKLAKRQANAAVALLKMDKPERVWPLLKHSSDPRMRSYLIHRLGPFGAEARAIVKRLEEEPDVTIRRALVLSLGEFGEKEFPLGERALVVENLRQLYRNDPDPGLHGAAEWLLRHWKQSQWLKQTDEKWAKDKKQQEQRLERIRQELAKEKGAAKPQWYVNGHGQTMVVIPGPVEFWMGSPPTEQATVISTVGKIAQYELLHRQRIGRTFAIATKPVTMEQFVQSRKGHDYNSQYAPTVVDCPQNNATWYVATRYCNWLSEQEAIAKDQWCYEPNSEGEYSQGMKLKANYLRLSGYRLLTEAEWEYACRAGAVTSRYYGESVELLRKYAWYVSNSGGCTWPVGRLKPNDLGLFDMHGNVWCCCQERHKNYAQDPGGKPIEDNEDILSEVNDKEGRVGRGGSFDTQPEYVRSANRDSDTPSYRGWNVGFRPARTITAE